MQGACHVFINGKQDVNVRDAAVGARAVHTEQNTTRMYWKELSFAPKCF